MEILFATSNPHKIEEVRAILKPLRIDVIGLDALNATPPEPVEDGTTFAENARIKAQGYAKATEQTCLAEDSGLEVDALAGAPGVYSARYSGIGTTRAERDRVNIEKLLREMTHVPREKRAARFVCAMCLADVHGRVMAETRGTFEGMIADEPHGTNGFGYDPVLRLPDLDRTSAELTPAEKNTRSHRGEAARKMADKLRTLRRQGRGT